MTTTQTAPVLGQGPRRSATRKRPLTPSCVVVQVLLAVVALLWFFPMAWALFNSFRDYAYTAANGYVSFGGFTLGNYADAWEQGNFSQTMWNSVVITVPAVLITLFLSSCMAFVLARFSFKFNVTLLGVFVAANLLPPQALLIPIYRMFRALEVPFWVSDSDTLLNSPIGVIAANVAFQTGFCTFVLSNYMKTLPTDIYESAMVDGASIARQFWQLTLPLCRPPLAALEQHGRPEELVVHPHRLEGGESGDKFPVTSSLNNLKGQFFTDYNLLSAGSVIVAVPVLVIFFVLQKQFVAGLTLGSTKG